MHTAQLELVILIIWSTMQFKAFKCFFLSPTVWVGNNLAQIIDQIMKRGIKFHR